MFSTSLKGRVPRSCALWLRIRSTSTEYGVKRFAFNWQISGAAALPAPLYIDLIGWG